ncbi:MAG: DUF1428 domain-containing protein [bacterium]
MSYVDGFVAAVPKANREKYLEHASAVAAIFKDHGALQVVENWSDDVPQGKVTSFWLAVQAKDDENVVLSWVLWQSKEARDAGWAKVMEDPRMATQEMPLDGKRLIYGGFQTILEV